MFASTTRKGTGDGVPYLFPMTSLVLKKYTRWSFAGLPPKVRRLPAWEKVAAIDSPSFPVKIEGSLEASYTNSPGSAQTSTTAPDSTIIMHWPSLTLTIDPSEMMLASPETFEPRPLARFSPFAASTSAASDSQ